VSKYQELPFCVVVPTFNNAAKDRYLRNIKSIVMQDYANFHIVVIDDHSEDDTGSLIRKYLEGQKLVAPDRYRVLRN
jgi:glycosyltransferase involved in cell wall biosynthesis